MKKEIKLFKKTLDSKTMTKGEINALKKMLNRFGTPSENAKAKLEIYNNGDYYYKEYKLTREHSKQGIDYLRAFCFKKDGSIRAQATKQFSQKQINIIKNFKSFLFVGFYEDNSNAYSTYSLPIWRTIDKQGNHFDYICAHWGKPMVIITDHYGHQSLQEQRNIEPKRLDTAKDFFEVGYLEQEPEGFKTIATLFCDSSGFGAEGEAALTPKQALARVQALMSEYTVPLYAYIAEQGQFQVYVTICEKGV
jgi:hypothetical protein